MLKFGVLGAGRIGKVHARAVTSNTDAKLVAVADAIENAAQAVVDQYGCEIRTIDATIRNPSKSTRQRLDGDVSAAAACLKPIPVASLFTASA